MDSLNISRPQAGELLEGHVGPHTDVYGVSA